MSLRVGTSGWAYKEWQPALYPTGLGSSEFLRHYATVFDTVEVNATAYRLQREEVTATWAADVPAHFRFVVRVHRRLVTSPTMAWSRADRGFLARFLATLTPLGTRLGGLMLPVPAERDRDDAGLAAVLAALPADLPVAVDFRNPTWLTPDVLARVADHGGTVCVSDTNASLLDRLPPGPFAYLRLRADHYPDAAREGWRDVLRREASERPVFAIARHEALPADDPHCGVGLARWLVAQGANG